MNNSISSPIFWMYFSYVLSFIIPLFCGLTLLTVKGAISSEQAGMHPRRLLGIIFTFSGLVFIPNMIQDIHKYITGELGLPIFDIAINLFLVPCIFSISASSRNRKTDIPKNLATLDAGNFSADHQFLFCPSARKDCGERRVL